MERLKDTLASPHYEDPFKDLDMDRLKDMLASPHYADPLKKLEIMQHKKHTKIKGDSDPTENDSNDKKQEGDSEGGNE